MKKSATRAAPKKSPIAAAVKNATAPAPDPAQVAAATALASLQQVLLRRLNGFIKNGYMTEELATGLYHHFGADCVAYMKEAFNNG